MAFLLQSNGRVDGLTMCILSDAYEEWMALQCVFYRMLTLYSLFVSWSFYWQSNGRVDGFTMCTLSDAYICLIIGNRELFKLRT